MNEKATVGCCSLLLSALLAQPASAQQQAPAPAAEPAPAPAPAAAEASGSFSFGTESGATAESHATLETVDDEESYEPKYGQFELGLILGFMIPSKDHNLRDEGSIQESLGFAPEIGWRGSFLPIPWLGVEAEGAFMASRTDNENFVGMFADRFHLIAQLPFGRVTPFILGGFGALGSTSDRMGTDVDPAIHFGLGVKYMFTHAFGMRLDLRDTMHQKFDEDQGVQTHSPEVLLGLTVAFEPRHAEKRIHVPADGDGDGFIDTMDKCPTEAGISPDGCPDKDSDGDTVFDSKDACPNEAGPPATCGCGVKDTDGDGVPDALDKCPTEPGNINGCPDLDPDRDGINVPDDKCPDKPETRNGYEDEDGCPDEIPEKIKKFTGVIKGIEFDTGKDTIRQVSEPVLENALLVLNEYPKTRIEISGHTDDVGKREDNVDLSQRRADSVKKWFVSKGVDEKRIKTRGAGPDEPIADNATAAGKQKNRRIEFKLLQ